MTKKDYEAIAQIIKSNLWIMKNEDVVLHACNQTCRAITTDLIELFKKDNPNFNKEKFYTACGFTLEN